jgi:hypothetical protein
MQLMKKLHHRHAVPPAFAVPAPDMPQPDNAQPNAAPASNTQPPVAAPADPNNPYGSIVSRNVFGLNPLPPPGSQDQDQGPPPPKITLTGITTIFGPAEALFNVAGVVRNGQPPHDESYIFTEGEEEDDVQVETIDTKKNVVTFKNHGAEQVIALIEGTASSGSAPSAPSWPGQNFRPRRFGRNFGGGPGNVPHPFQPQSYNNGPSDNGNGDSTANNQPGGFNNYNNNSSANVHNYSTVSPAIAALSPDDQAALIAAQHAQMEQNGDPTAIIMPPTPYDEPARQEAAGDNGGNSGQPQR